jgi:hypothetical protein
VVERTVKHKLLAVETRDGIEIWREELESVETTESAVEAVPQPAVVGIVLSRHMAQNLLYLLQADGGQDTFLIYSRLADVLVSPEPVSSYASSGEGTGASPNQGNAVETLPAYGVPTQGTYRC